MGKGDGWQTLYQTILKQQQANGDVSWQSINHASSHAKKVIAFNFSTSKVKVKRYQNLITFMSFVVYILT